MSILAVTASTVTGRLTKLEKAIFDIHIPSSEMVVTFTRAAPRKWEREYLEQTGKKAKPVGDGTNAVVYAHPSNKEKVIKVVYREDKCWQLYMSVVRRIRSRSLLKYMPRIYAGAQNDDGTSIHIIERLLPFSKARAEAAYKDDPYPWEHLRYSGYDEALVGNLETIISDMVYGKYGSYNDFYRAFKHNAKHPFVRLLSTLERRCFIDTHEGNIMFRRNGEMVLLDPVADST